MLATLSASLHCLLCRLWHQWRNATALNPLHKLLASSPELEEHAALLLPLCDHLEGVQAAVAPVAVPAAECDEGAVKAVVPGSILVHVPEAVLICTDYKTQRCQMINRAEKYFILFSKITYYLLFSLQIWRLLMMLTGFCHKTTQLFKSQKWHKSLKRWS